MTAGSGAHALLPARRVMMMRSLTVAGMLVLPLLGCARHGHEAHPAGHEAQATPAAGHEAHEGGESRQLLKLDDGKKWTADRHTADSIARMEQIVSQSPAAADAATLADATALGNDLQAALDELIGGCKMTGEAHAQLHVLLGELIPQVQALRGATDLAKAKEVVGHVKTLLAEYHEYFELPA